MSLFRIADLEVPEPDQRRGKGKREKVSGASAMKAARLSAVVERLAEQLPPHLDTGDVVTVVSHGDWNVAALVEVLLCNFQTPVVLHMSTWSVSDDSVRQLARLRDSGRISEIHALFDVYAATLKQAAFGLMKNIADTWAVRTVHAKVYTLISESEGKGISVCTSGNLTSNRRIEAGTVICDLETARFHRQWITQAMDGAAPFEEQEERKHVTTTQRTR